MRYLDASAIVPLLVQEPRTADARAALTADAAIVTWWGTRVESTSAIARLERAKAVTPRQASQAIEVLRSLAGGGPRGFSRRAMRPRAMTAGFSASRRGVKHQA